MQSIKSLLFIFLSSCIDSTLAAPAAHPIATPAPTPAPAHVDIQLSASIHINVGSALSHLNQPVNSIAPSATGNDVFSHIQTDLNLAFATQAPIAVSAASKTLSGILANKTPVNIYAFAGELVAAGLTSQNVKSAFNFVAGEVLGENSFTNINLRQPFPFIYPKANLVDAPYSLSEAQLRAAIYIPPTFKYGAPGAPTPVILIPGTGNTGYITFAGNFIPLLQKNSQIADPVWLNIPGFLNDNAQVNAEYVAYAINYISGICGNRKIAITAWSQGNINAQWAFKYWPSTRNKVSDHVAISPDYHGTILADFAATPDIPLPQGYLQQDYNSDFITTLRSNNGDSAYVPTTTIYSGLIDEIVEPQQGHNASAFLLDARNVGVTNNEVQNICPGRPAGTFYTHEGVMYNPITWALFKDALSHSGPGQVSRIDTAAICDLYLTQGLDLSDFLVTENTVLIAVLSLIANDAKSTVEEGIASYARN